MLPSLFISHGSPMLALQPGSSSTALAALAASLPRPRAILVVSAHWETPDLRLGSSTQPETLHDFYGFPQELFEVQYPAPGSPELAHAIQQLLTTAGLPTRLDAQRGLDHGAWVPLCLMYPQADIPVLQLSLPSQAGPALQLQIGRLLTGLRQQDVLLLGSGSITHNLSELDWRSRSNQGSDWAITFRDWMTEKLQTGDQTALLDYRQQAPWAVRAHPSDEHLLPLFFALGAGEQFSILHQDFTLGSLGMDIYRFD